MFLKLWFFPLGGGHLSRNKTEQLKVLKQFNLTKEGIDCRVTACEDQLIAWTRELQIKKNVDSE